MKHLPLLLLALFSLFAPAAQSLRAQTLPMFTHDFYVADPKRWLDKEVTLSIAYVELAADSKLSASDTTALSAYTFYNHQNGGHMTIAAPTAVADRLKRTCGMQVQRNAGYIRTTQIHGTFKEKKGQYYVQVDK